MTPFFILLIVIALLIPMLSLHRKRLAGEPTMQPTRTVLTIALALLVVVAAILLFLIFQGRAA